MPGSLLPKTADEASWREEIQRIFTPGEKLVGVGTPKLVNLVSALLGKSSIDDGELTEFMLMLSGVEDESIADYDVRRERRALARGACAWLFMPAPQQGEEYERHSQANLRNKNRPKYNALSVRQAWAYRCFRMERDGQAQDVYNHRVGADQREAFRDALIGCLKNLAVTRDRFLSTVAGSGLAVEMLSPNRFTDESIPLGPLGLRSALRRLESAPTRYAHYPGHLTTSVLARQLEFYENKPVQKTSAPSIDRLPVLPTPLEHHGLANLAQRLEVPGSRLLLTGGPGSGKSTLVRALAITRLESKQQQTTLHAPLSAVAAQAAADGSAVNVQTALRLVMAQCKALLGLDYPDSRQDYLESLERDPRLCVLLDGLDEVPEGLRDVAEDLIMELEAIAGSILISGRRGSRRSALLGWTHLDVGSYWGATAFIDLWFEDPDHPGRQRALDTIHDPIYKSVLDSPLLVGFIAQVSELQRDFNSIGDLYDQYVTLTLERSWKGSAGASTDDTTIHRLKATARTIAWKMSRGETRSSSKEGSGWQGQATLGSILDSLPREEHADAVALVKLEALFVLSTVSASRLHATYEWSHRSIQEHLVGAYLKESFRSSGAVDIDLIMSKISGDEDWSTALIHAISQLDDGDRVSIYEAIAALDLPGLDGRILLDLKFRILGASPPDSRIRSIFVETASTFREMAIASAFAPELAQEAVLPLLADMDLSGVDLDYATWLVDDASEEWMARALAALRSRANPVDALEVLLLTRRSEFAPLESAREYLGALSRGAGGIVDTWPGQVTDQSGVELLLSEVSELEWPEPRWRATVMLVQAVPDLSARTLEGTSLRTEEVAVAELARWVLSENSKAPGASAIAGLEGKVPDPTQVVIGALAGDYGAVIASEISQRLPPADFKVMPEPKSLNDWVLPTLMARNFAGGGFLNLGLMEGIDPIAVVRSLQSDVLQDPVFLFTFLSALHNQHWHNPEELATELVQCLLRVNATPPIEPPALTAPHFSLERFNEMIAGYFKIRGIDAFITSLEATSATEWLPFDGQVPALGDVWRSKSSSVPPGVERFQDGRDMGYDMEGQRFLRLVNWGATGNLPILKSLHLTLDFRWRVLDLLETADPRALEIEGNLDWLDETMSRNDLYGWRVRKREWLTGLRSRVT